MTDEFSIIKKYFDWRYQARFPAFDAITLGIGDDAAVLDMPSDKQLVVCVDTLIEGVHFPEDTSPHAIAHKALSVNLSDLAAMGADPAWFTLALTLPEVDEAWLQEFSNGLKALSNQQAIYLVGGDTTKGKLSITIQAMGWLDPTNVMKRSGANHGDYIYISGTVGDAAAGLAVLQQRLYLNPYDTSECVSRLEYPQARLSLSRLIRGSASACIDVSDGLVADLSHILNASQMGAKINVSQIPLSPVLKKLHNQQKALEYALTGGDDYELLFTVKPADALLLEELVQKRNMPITAIGIVDKNVKGIEFDEDVALGRDGYRHF